MYADVHKFLKSEQDISKILKNLMFLMILKIKNNNVRRL